MFAPKSCPGISGNSNLHPVELLISEFSQNLPTFAAKWCRIGGLRLLRPSEEGLGLRQWIREAIMLTRSSKIWTNRDLCKFSRLKCDMTFWCEVAFVVFDFWNLLSELRVIWKVILHLLYSLYIKFHFFSSIFSRPRFRWWKCKASVLCICQG